MLSNYQWIRFELGKNLQKQIAELMNRSGLSVYDIADGLGVSVGHVMQLFNGREHLSVKALVRIVTILGGELGISGGEYYIKDKRSQE